MPLAAVLMFFVDGSRYPEAHDQTNKPRYLPFKLGLAATRMAFNLFLIELYVDFFRNERNGSVFIS